MLWIALHLPQLSLESFAATLPAELRAMPLALIEARRIAAANASARALGIKPGMTRATALGLAPQLVTGAADAQRDAQALQAVLQACLAFTPAVAAPPLHERPRADAGGSRKPRGHEQGGKAPFAHGALLEVQASLRYFGGLPALLRRLRAALTPLGHTLQVASAPTAQGAALLARGATAGERHCADPITLQRALAGVPLGLLDAGREHADALQGMGLRTLADLKRVPRAGLVQRFGEAMQDEVDRAFGARPDPRTWVVLPPTFAARLELFARADNTEQVLHGAGVLLARLVAWLSAQHAFVRSFTLQLQHESRQRRVDTPPASMIEVALAAPSRDLAHLMLLLRERLARTQLAAPALELGLRADDIARAPPPNGELFASAQGEREGLTRLVERLQARLGRHQVLRPLRLHDHRPERSSALQEVDASALPAGATRPAHGRVGFAPLPITRPIWLVEPPQPLADRRERPLLDGAPLQLLSGPERIEAGWWDDDGLAGRDYFIAQAGDASLVWIYRLRLASLAPGAGWYLHGRFG
jgi:protein ImuB